MKPSSTIGRTPAALYASKVWSVMVKSYTGLPSGPMLKTFDELHFNSGNAVAGGEQMMSANVDGIGAEVMQLPQKLAAVLHCCVIRLVVAEPAIDGFEGSLRLGEIDVHAYLAVRTKGGGKD